MQNVARVQRTAISQGEYRSLGAKLSWLDAGENWKFVCWIGTKACSDNAQSVIKNAVNEASMRAASPNWCRVLSSLVDQGQGS